jgi:hypothetical protein
MGLRVEFQTIGEDGAKYTVQPTPSEFAIVVDTQDNWARQYVYRDVFESVGEALSDSNPYLSKNIKEIYKRAYNPEATENELDKQLQKEVKTGFKDPAKVKAFSDALNIAITEGKEKQMNKNKGIAEIQATITAPKGTKAQLIEMIREMVTDPVDRLKLKMESKSKGDLQTLYIKMKAIHDWYKKNRPGEGIDYI